MVQIVVYLIWLVVFTMLIYVLRINTKSGRSIPFKIAGVAALMVLVIMYSPSLVVALFSRKGVDMTKIAYASIISMYVYIVVFIAANIFVTKFLGCMKLHLWQALFALAFSIAYFYFGSQLSKNGGEALRTAHVESLKETLFNGTKYEKMILFESSMFFIPAAIYDLYILISCFVSKAKEKKK